MSQVRRFIIPLGVFALLVVLLAVGLKQAPEKGIIVSPLIGKPAPALSVPQLGDPASRLTAEGFKGQWYLVNFWGTWCEECRYEHPMLLEVKNRFGLPILGVDWNDEDATAQEFLGKLGNPYAQVGTDHDGRAAIDYGVYGAPETYLVNPQGIIVQKVVGALTPQVWQNKFQPLIEGAKP